MAGNAHTAPKLAVSLRDEIEELIATQFFKPGDKLEEAFLTKRFGVSRTPVREALAYLEAAGFLEIIPNRGCFVKELSPRQLIDMFETMAALEATTASLAAERIDDIGIKKLQKAHARCKAAAERTADAYFFENELFHFAVYEACHNNFLIAQTKSLFARLKPYRRLQLRIRGRIKASLHEHQSIVDAILAGDGGRAGRLVREHVAIQGVRFSELMRQLDTE